MSRPPSERPAASRVLSHLGVMAVVSVVLGIVVAGLAIPFAGVLGFTTRNVADTMDELPAELQTEALPQRTRVVDGQGNLLATLFDENRVNVSLSQVSRPMVQAIVAIEDYRFYEHGALDVKGTLRALVTNQASSGVVQGGSSITQQLVKLTLVQQADSPEEALAAKEETYARKINELRYAIALEQQQSKDWILERYLNTAFFGDGAYGIQAAARHYFDVNAKKLNVKQSAMLAGLVQSPTAYDPSKYPDRATQRRNIVLDRMAQLNVIPDQQADKLKARKLGLKLQDTRQGCLSARVPFFCQYVVNYLEKDKALGKTVADRRQLLNTGGLTIRTTVDLDMQKAADEAVRGRVFATDSAVGALALVEPGSGKVRAIAQSRPMGFDKKKGETFLNYAVPKELGDSNGFQAGSTFKVFVLAQALEQGLPLSTTYDSPAVKTFNLADYKNCSGAPSFGAGSFEIPNSTSSGLMNMYTGTRLSVNTFFMRLEQDTGVCDPYRLAKSMGVRLTNPTGDANGLGAERIPNFTLGTANASPLEMAEAYATFAARGVHCDSRPVTSILDANGNKIKDYADSCQRVLQESTADAVSDVLRGVIEGGFAAAQALDQPAAGKTGTTNDGKSVWFVGYTANMAGAATIGGANEFGTPIGLAGQTVGGGFIPSASGSGFAAPIWGDAMKVIDDNLANEPFIYPSATPGAGQTSVPAPAAPVAPAPPTSSGGNGNNGNGRGGRG
ncbi:transglycosylase domain-containing protein [Nocardioides salsibiostraticola]